MGGLKKSRSIEGVRFYPQRIIADKRGPILHMLRADAAHFKKFGEVYFSEVKPKVVKGWKRHFRTTQFFAVPHGRIKVVIFDGRARSKTRGNLAVYVLGRPDSYGLLSIPPHVWYGFQCVAKFPSLVANCTDRPHDPDESESIELNCKEIPYDWKKA